ncbi:MULTISPECIES: flagellar basal body-associated FliL family protein [Thalassolituus]|jgi:flagellar FliL protein|uniref:flagellar basal body-associated FliL family protein n=1 Tax=Thalassolituus TaxID=187492 RepID=UPI000C4A972B|nr:MULTISPECIES: flagellar basal body-associated FliL family protein [Thalassolituus]MCA6059109.1 flagellar basal body-associated protein FliL [Thalassolituus sp. ST750PaO-4]MCB2387674.1 flagellar basal body-associated protein FliL [Thalassolituus alkanivorans]MCB2424924.1 flagellar basal body-associated protein FliL [Thalassolituus alkanivorans]PIQ40643.1 MAG: flagellar basal body-associated protein FliL [Thalassolituus sp. CG17_big_fil_post_rev_8_21_14_2_50_53_8]
MFRRFWKLMSATGLMLGLLMTTAGISQVVQAEEETAVANQTKYIHLEPAFVVNYGSTGRMKYLRTEIALKVSGNEAAAAVSQHKPYIRNNLVMLLSAQESETMNSSQGRESLRKVALDEVRALMVQLEGSPLIDDLYFSNFVVQN